ncbi:Transglutaminase-like enzyme, putative cysteine protease [Rhodovulum sp. ES.010]|uniref:transglutaminase family protein n=1 Tax=Rhodovulum sp. ES.010 TaxID=1882821 RepID=UPI00092752AF|nr:transglutaminase family protein [Rhodovulum sp. ES.010]SIO54198.1 Transglutaminase-like enzyme, putative cysteine protease [Rhodovulum sp. ES.010]
MRLRIAHTTRYRFDAPVTFGLQQLRKTPKSGRQQEVLSWTTTVTGGTQELFFDDHHHNRVDLISFGGAAPELTVTCEGEVEMRETHGIVGRHIGPAPLWLFRRYTPRTKPGPGVRALLRDLDGATDLDGLHALSALIRARVAYEIGTSDAGWGTEEALAAGRGVCQDHTHIFITCARELGLPARYVSGYLRLDDREEQDAMHAWAEAHVEGLGWVGFDVSNGISPDIRYIRVATGLDYAEAAPVTGLRHGGSGEALSVEIEVAQQ